LLILNGEKRTKVEGQKARAYKKNYKNSWQFEKDIVTLQHEISANYLMEYLQIT
jgi:hypothetical protein